MARSRRERIFIVPRPAGLVFALLLLMIFMTGFAYPPASGLTRTLGIALIVAGLVALIQSNENLRGIEITGCRAQPTAAGQKPVMELTVRNNSPHERIGLQLRLGQKWTRAWWSRAGDTAWLPVLEAGETALVRLPLPTCARGRYQVPEIWIGSVMPVGTCYAWKSFRGLGEFFVYPRPQGAPLDEDGLHGAGVLLGRTSAGGNEDVSGHRPYEPGDPLSRMDWRVFARTGKVVVRTMEEGGKGEIVLRWRDTAHLRDLERRLEQLSCWLTQCEREARIFRLDLGDGHGELGHRNILTCQVALAVFGEPEKV